MRAARRATTAATLAELYALSEDRALQAQAREPFGFARAMVERA